MLSSWIIFLRSIEAGGRRRNDSFITAARYFIDAYVSHVPSFPFNDSWTSRRSFSCTSGFRARKWRVHDNPRELVSWPANKNINVCPKSSSSSIPLPVSSSTASRRRSNKSFRDGVMSSCFWRLSLIIYIYVIILLGKMLFELRNTYLYSAWSELSGFLLQLFSKLISGDRAMLR